MMADYKALTDSLYMNVDDTSAEKTLRKFVVEKSLDTIENIAVMTCDEVCDLITEHFFLVFSNPEEFCFVEKKDIETFKQIAIFLER